MIASAISCGGNGGTVGGSGDAGGSGGGGGTTGGGSNSGTATGNYQGVTVTVTINGITQSVGNLTVNVQ